MTPDEIMEVVAEAKRRCLAQCKDPQDRNALFEALAGAFESMVYEGIINVELLASITALVVIFPELVN